MAWTGKREAKDDRAEQAGGAAEQVAQAASELAAEAASSSASEDATEVVRVTETVTTAEPDGEALVTDAVTEVHETKPLPIPPLLTDADAADGGAAVPSEPVQATAVSAETPGRDRIAEAASVVRDRAADRAGLAREKAAEHAGAAREKAVEHAAAAREKLADGAGEARERLAEGAAEAKVRGARMRKRFAEAAADARDSASSAAAEARDRVANTDVNELAHYTTRLIDQARPFFLAGFAVVFAILGFIEGDSATAQLFVGGSILFVIGAGFSGEINTILAHRFHHHGSGDAAPPREREVDAPPHGGPRLHDED